MNCAIYCRLSKEDGGSPGESESIRNQRDLLTRYAREQGWRIHDVYCDDDYSGADGERPRWNDLLREGEGGAFQVVLCTTLSRFTRDIEVVERVVHGLLPRWGIRFIALLDHMDTDIIGNKKARQISGLVNEWYLEDLSDNVRSVLDQKRRQGLSIASFPAYGYRKDPRNKGRLAVDEEAAQTVRWIFARYLAGVGTQRIAQELNGAGVLTPAAYRAKAGGTEPDAALWRSTTVSRVLRNEIYIGNLVQGKKRKQSYKSKRLEDVAPDRWFRAEGVHEPIVAEEAFRAAAQRLGQRARSGREGVAHPLAGKVRCGLCGSAMQRIAHRYKGRRNAYLQCSRYARTRGAPQCVNNTVPLEQLTEAVTEGVGQLLREYEPGDLRRFSSAIRGEEAGELRRNRETLRRDMERLEAGIRSLYLDKAEGVLSGEEYAALKAAFLREKEQVAARMDRLEEAARDSLSDEASLEAAVQRLLSPEALSPALLDALVHRIEVASGEAVIYWRV